MDPEEYRLKIERDILQIIEEKLINGSMDAERATEIARFVLDKLHPPLTLEQLHAILPTLDDHFSELARAVYPLEKQHEKELSVIVAAHAEQLIKSGKFGEAHALLKDATQPKTSQ